jgi:hypothetical protein
MTMGSFGPFGPEAVAEMGEVLEASKAPASLTWCGERIAMRDGSKIW